MRKLTRFNPDTWEKEECSLVDYLLDNGLYKHTDRGQLEQLGQSVEALETIILKMVGFLEKTHGKDFTQEFLK